MLNHYHIYKSCCKTNSAHLQEAYNEYLRYKSQYRIKLRNEKKIACENFINNSNNKCKAAWDIISNENMPSRTIPTDLNPENLNNYFIDSVEELSNRIPITQFTIEELLGNKVTDNSLNWKPITSSDIIKTVSKFSNSKSMDHYFLSNFVIKKTIHLVINPLAIILNKCLEKGYFSDLLKVTKVIPVFKKGDKSLPQNYRPISIVPIFSKLFESLIYRQMVSFFENNNLLTNSQFGFREGRSTTRAVLEVVESTLTAFENRESTTLVLCDLTKAFDCVPFEILLEKLRYYGLNCHSIQILSSYLTNRQQYVTIKGKQSTSKLISKGVPQGSVLGPFLFIVMINDLPKNLRVDSVIFADDSTLLASDSDLERLESNIQVAINSAYNWFSCNKLLCNQEKTQQILLSLSHDQDLHSVKLLGFHIDNRLNWSIHIDNVCKKICRVSFLIWKLKNFISNEYLRMTYFALFQSHIQYGIIIWGHSSHVNKILLIQKRVVRSMCDVGALDHCRPLFTKLKILTVINLYIFQILLHTKTNLESFQTREEIHYHNTRNKNKIDVPQHRLALTGKHFKLNCIHFFNKLDKSAINVNFNIFKNKLNKWLIDHPFYSLQEFCDVNVDLTF